MLRRCGVVLVLTTMSFCAAAKAQSPADVAVNQLPSGKLSPAALETLVAGVALYADPIVKQVLDAARHPTALHQAARTLTADSSARRFVLQLEASWPQSVRSLRQHPELLTHLDQRLSLTTRLGIAYKTQPEDVWAAIGTVRARSVQAAQELAAAAGGAGGA
jgi:hypothetical protein